MHLAWTRWKTRGRGGGYGSWGVENTGFGKYGIWLKTRGQEENTGRNMNFPHYNPQHLSLKRVSRFLKLNLS